MTEISLLDVIALSWFLTCWIGYHYFSKFWSGKTDRLQNALKSHIDGWVAVLQRRELRMVDTSVVANLERNAAFFASSSLLVIAGLLTVIGSADKAISFFSALPFARENSVLTWELKLLILVLIYAYAFFTFTWCMRQYGFISILVGRAPLPGDGTPEEERREHGKHTGQLLYLAVLSFNSGLRANYFSISVLFWFMHPLLFMFAAAWVTAVLYHREFHSRALKALV